MPPRLVRPRAVSCAGRKMAERIEWRFPPSEFRRMMWMLGFIALMISLILVPGNIFMWHTKLHQEFFTLSLVILGLQIILWIVVPISFNRASNARYFVDDTGLHIEPGRTFRWEELRNVDVINWVWPPGRRVIQISAVKPMRSRVLAFEPSSVDEHELVAFCRTRLGPAPRPDVQSSGPR